MKNRRYWSIPGPSSTLTLRRRDVLRGGLGVITTVAMGTVYLTKDDAKNEKAEAEATADAKAEEESGAEAQAAKEAEKEEAPANASESGEKATEDESDGDSESKADSEPALYRRGDNGDGVLALQKQLSSTGYWCGTPDGGYGHLTEQAVFALQKAHELYRDGIAGPDVRAAAAKDFLPKAVGGGNLVEVHLATQLIHLVRDGKTMIVLNTSTASGERYEFRGQMYTARTRPGDFAVRYVDGTGWRDGELGEMWRPMFYSGNYAIHGSPSIPPWPASHGCSRLSVAAMDMIWRDGLMSMGSRVLVV